MGESTPDGTVNLSSPRAIFAGSPPRFTRSRVTYEAYAVSRTSTRPQVDSATGGSIHGVRPLYYFVYFVPKIRSYIAAQLTALATA